MSRCELILEIKYVEEQYHDECNNNGGREGSTLSYGLRSQIDILIMLLEKYFNEKYEYKRMIELKEYK
jgi:hypothetical protein